MKLDDIEKLIAEASPGPWSNNGHFVVANIVIIADTFSDANSAFIAASRQLMPKLLKVARVANITCESIMLKHHYADCPCFRCDLSKALAELEQP